MRFQFPASPFGRCTTDGPSLYPAPRLTEPRRPIGILWTAAALLVLSPCAARAATPPSAQATVAVAFTKAETAGDLNVVVVGWSNSTASVQSVQDSAGNVYLRAIGPTAGYELHQSIYYASKIAGGANTVTVQFTQTADADVRILEYSGYASLDAVAGIDGDSAYPYGGYVTTTVANELVIGAMTAKSTTSSAGSGFTARILTQDGNVAEDRTVSAVGRYIATAVVHPSAPWVMQTATFSATAGSAQTALSSLSCSSTSETGAASDACTVSLTGAAPSGGIAVSFSSSDSAVTLPASVTIPSGATSVGFTAAAAAVTSTQTATLTASAGGVSKALSLTLNAYVAKLSLSTTSLAFGNVALNTPATQSVTLTSSGTAPVTVSAASISGTGFTASGVSFPATLSAGQSATLVIQFDPAGAGAATGSLSVASNASSGGTGVISLSGTGQASAALSALSCSSASETGAASDACTVSLTGAASSGGLSVSLASSDSAATLPASVTVPAGSTSAAFTVAVAAVSSNQAVTLNASAAGVSKTFALTLQAYVATLSVNSSSIAFGDVQLNTPVTQSVTLTSSGTAPVTISATSVSGAEFSASGLSLPATLSAGQSATLNVQFKPTSVGAASGTVSFASNCSMGAMAINLSGTGMNTTYTVDLTWDAPSSSPDPVAGYNIYRATAGGAYQLLNATVNLPTSFADMTAQSGVTYSYEVMSVDAAGNESAPSNVYTASVP